VDDTPLTLGFGELNDDRNDLQPSGPIEPPAATPPSEPPKSGS
jgi:hypothetical protein